LCLQKQKTALLVQLLNRLVPQRAIVFESDEARC
jgi:hypothetical protein